MFPFCSSVVVWGSIVTGKCGRNTQKFVNFANRDTSGVSFQRERERKKKREKKKERDREVKEKRERERKKRKKERKRKRQREK